MQPRKSKIVVVGGANIDTKARLASEFVGTTSHPGTIWRTSGGVGRNIAQNISSVGCPVALMAPFGDDLQAQSLLSELRQADVDLTPSFQISGQRTGSYMAVFTNDGELMIGVADMQIMDAMSPQHVKQRADVFINATVVVTECNLPTEVLAEVLQQANQVRARTVVDPVSGPKAVKLRGLLDQLHTVTPNRDELGMLSDSPVSTLIEVEQAATRLVQSGVKRVVTTLGPEGVLSTDKVGSKHIPARSLQVLDVTGAGDAFTAGLVCGYYRGLDINQSIHMGQGLAEQILLSTDSVIRGATMHERSR
jgi:pseudouridine kinase